MGISQGRMGAPAGQGRDSTDWGQEPGVSAESNGFQVIL